MMEEQGRRAQHATLGEHHGSVVGAIAGNVVVEIGDRGADIFDRVALPPGVIWGIVEKIDSGGGGAGTGTVEKVEFDGLIW